MHKKVDGDGGKGLVNISRLPKSVWPNLPYEGIYFDAKEKSTPFILQPNQAL